MNKTGHFVKNALADISTKDILDELSLRKKALKKYSKRIDKVQRIAKSLST